MIDYVEAEYVKEKINDKNVVLLDVRTEDEYNQERIQNSLLIDISKAFEYGRLKSIEELRKLFDDLPRDKEVIVFCHSGGRAQFIAPFLEDDLKIKDIKIFYGSIMEWENKGYPLIRN